MDFFGICFQYDIYIVISALFKIRLCGVLTGRWQSSNVHQSSGDSQDSPAGGRWDLYGDKGPRLHGHQRARLVWSLQG